MILKKQKRNFINLNFPNRIMKILAIADTHGDSALIKKVGKLAKKEKVDLVLHGGDLTWFGENSKGIIKPITDNAELFFVHGNHDPKEILKTIEEKYSKAKSIHEKYKIKNNIGFFGSGTTDWGFKEDADQVFKELKRGHEKIKNMKKKVMIQHCPPVGSAIELLGFPGSYGTRKAIDKFKPDVLVCGHIHEGGGIIEQIGKTKVINVARTPTIFEI